MGLAFYVKPFFINTSNSLTSQPFLDDIDFYAEQNKSKFILIQCRLFKVDETLANPLDLKNRQV